MDEVDRIILRRLRDDARISFKDLGDAVGLSANAAAERFRRLVQRGVIRRFRAEIDPSAGGARLGAFVDLRLAPGMPADRFEHTLRALSGVVTASLTSGNFDYTVRVAVPDEAALVTLIEALRANGAAETHSRIILREMALA